MTEVWAHIDGFAGYEISNLGNVRSNKRAHSRTLKPCIKKGYPQVGLFSDGKHHWRHIHSLVAAAFIGPRPKRMVVCHLNGDRMDNRASNLRYDTYTNNEADKSLHGTRRYGETATAAKLTEEAVMEIRALLTSTTQTTLAKRFGVAQCTISAIANRKIWSHI